MLAINLFTSNQAREEVWVILKDLEFKRQNMEQMRARMEEAEKHATMLMFLNDSAAVQHEEVKQKNDKLCQLLSLKEQEIRYLSRCQSWLDSSPQVLQTDARKEKLEEGGDQRELSIGTA